MSRYTEFLEKIDEVFLPQISEMLLGYREGSLDDMLVKIQYLVNLEKEHNRQSGVNELYQAIHDLHYLAEDLEAEDVNG